MSQRATVYLSQGREAGEIARNYMMAASQGISGAAAYDQFTAAARVQAAQKGSFKIERRFVGRSLGGGSDLEGPYCLAVNFMGDRRKQLEEECPGEV